MADGSGPRTGQWQVVAVGAAIYLELTVPGSGTERRQLTADSSGKTFLDGERWFVVSFEECADL